MNYDETRSNAASGLEGEPQAGDGESGASELETLRQEAAELRDRYLRKAAEFDNFRRRSRQELEMLRQSCTASLMASLLPVIDDMDRMLSTHDNPEDPYRKGLEMIRGKFQAFLDAEGVQPIEALGKPFDPALHDAIMLRETDGFPPETVLEVVTPGYRINDQVLRHAQVIVSAPPSGSTAE